MWSDSRSAKILKEPQSAVSNTQFRVQVFDEGRPVSKSDEGVYAFDLSDALFKARLMGACFQGAAIMYRTLENRMRQGPFEILATVGDVPREWISERILQGDMT